ncbi:MAG: AAA family ATPase [Gemmatimonadota bacterium]
MRFTRVSSAAFGTLRSFDTGPEPLGDLVVVEGHNEAGKTTFFELLSVLLYGFYPASRETNPFSPWNGEPAEATAVAELSSGGTVQVERRLLSVPRGAILRGGEEEDLRNRTVPWAEHVPRAVFRHVFALTLTELAALEGEGWDPVQDRLIGAMGADDLRSARTVVDELRAEAGRLWRPNRRGGQEIRELEDRLRQLRLRRRQVRDEETRMRELTAERDRVDRSLRSTRKEREEARIQLERLERLLPVKRRLERIRALERRGGAWGELSELPSAPGDRLRELETRSEAATRRIAELEAERREPLEVLEAFGPAQRALLDHQGEIEAAAAGWGAGVRSVQARRDQLARELRDRRRRLESGLRTVLDRALDEGIRHDLLRFPLGALREAVSDLVRARDEVDRATARRPLDTPEGSHPAPSVWPWVAASLSGILLLVAGMRTGFDGVAVAGGLLLGGGLVGGVQWRREGLRTRRATREAQERRDAWERHLDSLERRADAAHERLTALLSPLTPGPGAPGAEPGLASQLERLQELVQEEAERQEELARLEAEIDAASRRIRSLSELIPVEHRQADPSTVLHLLNGALHEAMARREAARVARRELGRLDRAVDAARGDAEAYREERAGLNQLLARLGGGDAELGLEEAEGRLAAHRAARQLRDELQREHPDLESLRSRIQAAEAGGESWVADPDAQAATRSRVEELTESIEAGTRRLQSLEKDVEHLAERTRLDEIDGEILSLEGRTEELARRRDRLWVLSRIVEEAERRVREEHQPAVLREASTLLARLTDGRYDRIVLAGRDGRSFRVRGPATPGSVAVGPPLSTGTREQVYLALRLAILDRLDRSGERLPLFLDEVLVNWDPERREAGLRLLAERSGTRQCFFFTCHPAVADRLEAMGGRRLLLERPT